MTLNLDELEAVRRRMIDADRTEYARARNDYNTTVDDNWLPLIAECRELRRKLAIEEQTNVDWVNYFQTMKAENERYRKALEHYAQGWVLGNGGDVAREALGTNG